MSQLLIDRPELTLGPDGLGPDDEIRLRGAIGSAAVALMHALLEQHNSAAQLSSTHQTIADFFAALAPLDGFFHELSFIASSEQAQSEIQVEGVFAQPPELSTCLASGPKDESASTLSDFFHRNHLVSVTIRREVTPAQLTTFLHMAAPTVANPAPMHLAEGLAAAGIVTISVLDREEIIPAKTGLSWRVRIGLSRLGKRLRDIPLPAHVTGREAQHLRVTVLREALHPLRPDHLLTEFVLNADLARTSGTDLQHMDVQGDLVTVLITQQVRVVAGFLVEQLTGPESGNVDFTWRARDLALFKRLFPRLADLLDEETVGILRAAVERKLVTLEELPANLRDALDADKLASALLASPTLSLARLRAVRDLENWRQFGSSFAGILSELIRHRKYAEANLVASVLAELASPASPAGPRVKQLASKACAVVASAANLERMATHLPRLASEDRAQLLAMLVPLGTTAAPLLVRRLHDNLDDNLRPGLRDLLASLGKVALPFVTRALLMKAQGAELYRNLLMVLAGMRESSTYELAASFLAAEPPRVRQAALVAMARADAGRAEPELVKALADSSLSVQGRAVEDLGAIGSRDPRFIAFLLDLFEGKMQSRVTVAGQSGVARDFASVLSDYYHLLTAGCAGVANLARRGAIDLSEFEAPLMRSLKKLDGTLVGLAARVLGKGPELDRTEEQRIAVAMALVTALAWIGTAACLPVLEDVCKHSAPRVERLATRAIEEITTRTS